MQKLWKYNKYDEQTKQYIKEQTNLSDVICKILAMREIDTAQKLDDFLYPALDKLSDPFTLPNMLRAVESILQYVKEEKTIVVYLDSDSISVIL